MILTDGDIQQDAITGLKFEQSLRRDNVVRAGVSHVESKLTIDPNAFVPA